MAPQTIAKGKKEPFFTATYQRSLGANEGSDGKVPVIEDGDFVLCESTPVSAYIDSTRGGGRLAGATAQERAAVSIFIDGVGAKVMQTFYPFLMAQTDEKRAEGKRAFDAALGAMSDALRARGGPFLLGASPSLADTSVWPFIHRGVVVLGHYRGFALLEGERFAPLTAWVLAMRALPAVQSTTADPKVLIEGYAGYAAGQV